MRKHFYFYIFSFGLLFAMPTRANAAACVDCGPPPPPPQPLCQIPLNNKPKDIISGAVIWNVVNYPNAGLAVENGATLTLSTSGNDFIETDVDIATSVPFAYVAEAANETISAFPPSSIPLANQNCTISASVTQRINPIKVPGHQLAFQFELIGAELGVLAYVCIGSTLGVCSAPAAIFWAATSFVGAKLATDAWVADPIDNNYRQLAQPSQNYLKIPSLGPIGPILTTEITALIRTNEQILSISDALTTTLNRESGAEAADDTYWVDRQAKHATELEGKLGALFALEIPLLKTLSATLTRQGLDYTITPAQALQFEQTTAISGLPPAQVSALEQLGVTPQDMPEIISALVGQNPNAVTGSIASSLANPSLLSALMQASFVLGGRCGLVYIVNASLGTRTGDPGFNPNADLNHDGVVNADDLALAPAQTPNGFACELSEVDLIRP
jgi:hypothetical protein